MSNKIKIGIIGTGGIFELHMASYLQNPDVEVYALCDINAELLAQKAEKYGITRTFTDKDEMLKLKELDAVSVCTWNCAHAECSIAALNAGKHVLCEKPMAMNAKEAELMKEAADRNGKLLMIGFVRRHGNDAKLISDLNARGDIGEIYYAKATYLRRNGNPGGWFSDFARSGGGPLIDLGVHVIDLARYLAGNPKPVSVFGATFTKLLNRPHIMKNPDAYMSSGATDNDKCDVEDLASAMIRFDNGMVISVEASFSLNIESDVGTLELFGDKAGVKITDKVKLFEEKGNYLVNTDFDMPTGFNFSGAFAAEINHFIDCINGKECIAPAEDGIYLMKILDAIYESAKTGHEVMI